MPARDALIIASAQYSDPLLCQLQAPQADATSLSEVLSNADIGGFQTKALIDRPSYEVAAAIEEFFLDRSLDDLLLLYFTGHGIKDADGRLYFATTNTKRNLLLATAVAASFVNDAMLRSRSRRQILILDCCHSGAFARGMVAKSDSSVGTRDCFEGTGRIVLTASDATQYALEAEKVTGSGVRSIFTEVLVAGLKSGEADTNCDGLISLDELFAYAEDQVRERTPSQKPMKWALGATGAMIIAQNKNPVLHPAELPKNILEALDRYNFPSIRQAAVNELGRMLQRQDRAVALAAELQLKELLTDDSRKIQELAQGFLDEAARRQSNQPTGIDRADAAPGEDPQETQVASAQVEREQQELEAKAAAEKARIAEEQSRQAEAERARLAEEERQRVAAAEQTRREDELREQNAAADRARLAGKEILRRAAIKKAQREEEERKNAEAEKLRAAETERLRAAAADKARLEQEARDKAAAEKAQREEEERKNAEAEKQRAAETERLRAAAAEKARLEQEARDKAAAEKARREEEERKNAEAEKLRAAETERLRAAAAEKARLEQEARDKAAAENARREEQESQRQSKSVETNLAQEGLFRTGGNTQTPSSHTLRNFLIIGAGGLIILILIIRGFSSHETSPPTTETDQPSITRAPSTDASDAPPAKPDQTEKPHGATKIVQPEKTSGGTSAINPAVMPPGTGNEFLPNIDKYRLKVQQNPKDPDARSAYGNALMESHDYDGAIEQFRVSVSLPPKDIGRAYLYRDLSEAYERKGDFENALQAIRKSVISWPVKNDPTYCSDPFERGAVGRILEEKGDIEGATAYWKSLVPVAKDPQDCQTQVDRLTAKTKAQ